MDETFFKEYEKANGFEFSKDEKELMAKQDYECDCCGNSFKEHNEDFYVVDDRCETKQDSMLCRSCYDEDYQYQCVICENMDENPTLENHHIYVSKALTEETGLKTGIYKVLSYPFFYGSILSGFDDFFKGSIRLLKEIDLEKTNKFLSKNSFYEYNYNGGNICDCCVSEWTEMPKHLYHKNNYLNEIFKSQKGLHMNINFKGIVSGCIKV